METPPLFNEWISSEPDEPKFGLLGRDPEAVETILHWVKLRRDRLTKLARDKMSPSERDKVNHELQQCTEAEQIAWKMQAFQKGYVEEEQAAVSETLREDLKNSRYWSDRVSNAVAETTDAIAYANRFGPLPPQYAHSVRHLRKLSDLLRKMHGGGK